MATAKSRSKPRPPMSFDRSADPPQPIGATGAAPQSARENAPEISGSSQAPAKPGASEITSRQASRVGKRAVTFYVSPDAFRQLGVLSAQTDKSIQLIMTGALDWVFREHGQHRIAKE